MINSLILASGSLSKDKISFSIEGNGIKESRYLNHELKKETNEAIIHYEYANNLTQGHRGKVIFVPTNAKIVIATWREMEDSLIGGLNKFLGNVLSDIVSGNGYFELTNPVDSNVIFAMKGAWGDKGYNTPSSKGKKGTWELTIKQ